MSERIQHLETIGERFDGGRELDFDLGGLAEELGELLVAAEGLLFLQGMFDRHHQERDLQLHLPEAVCGPSDAAGVACFGARRVAAAALNMGPERVDDAVMVVFGAQLLHQLVHEHVHLGPLGDDPLVVAVEALRGVECRGRSQPTWCFPGLIAGAGL